jgi:hypothetical protein
MVNKMKSMIAVTASAALALSALAIPSAASAQIAGGEILSDAEARLKCGFNNQQIARGFYCVKTIEFSATGESRQIGSKGRGNANPNSIRCQDQYAETVTYSSYNFNSEWMEERTVVEYGDVEWGSSYRCDGLQPGERP